MTAFYGLYFFGFRRMSFHTLNRFYLLASLVLSLTIPLISYERTEIVLLESQPIEEVIIPTEEIQENTYASATQPATNIEVSPEKDIDWLILLNTIYLVGVGSMFLFFFKNIILIVYRIKKTASTSLSYQENLKILLTKSQSNSSFFNYIFLNPENLTPHEQELIIAHESFHAQRLHTLDLLFSSILKSIFWFNPIVYFYQKSLKQIHEYEVDALMSATYDGREYAHLLLKLGVAPNAMIINQFSTKPLSERIQFLFKTPTKNMKKLLYLLSLPIIGAGIMAFAQEKVNTIYKEKASAKTLQPMEVKEYPLVINDEKNRASWTLNNSFNTYRFSPANISINKIQIKNYNGFHYYVNPNSLTINMIEQVNRFIGKRFLALVITEKELDAQGNLSKLGLAIKHLRTNQVSPTEVFDMTELREKGKTGGYFIMEGYDKNFKTSGIIYNEGTDDLTISQGELRVITTINQTSDLILTKAAITYKVSPDKFNLSTLDKVKSYFAKEGFNLEVKNPIFDKNKKLLSAEIQLSNGKEINKKQFVLDDLRHLIKSKTSQSAPNRWDETITIEANKITRESKIFVDNRWLEGIKKSDKFEVLKVTNNIILSKIDSSRFSYNTNVKVPKNKVDSFNVISNQEYLVEGRDYVVKNNVIFLNSAYKNTKIAYRLYMKPLGSIVYPELTKLNKVEFPDMRFASKTPIVLAKNENNSLFRYTTLQTRPSTPFSNVSKKQDTLRTILETNKLGKNPLVFINGEEYPSSILYRINPDVVTSTAFYPPNNKSGVERFGEAAKDGVIKISTKEDDFILKNDKQHKIAIENVRMRLIESKKRVRRQIYQNSNGVKYEEISFQSSTIGGTYGYSVKLPRGQKVIFFLDDKLVSEEEINNNTQSFTVNVSKDEKLKDKYSEELKNADVIFNLKTKQD